MSSTSTTGPVNNTQTIARNSFWFGLEMVVTIFVSLISSILVARVIGPVRLGPYNYVMWLTNITASVGSMGLPITTRKYMAEHLNRGESGTARAIYKFALRLQILIASAGTAVAALLVFYAGDPGYHTVSLLLVLNIAPRMIGFIPSQANNAAETMRRNTAPSVIGALIMVTSTLFSLWIGWGLVGVATGAIAGTLVELTLKLRSVHAWLSRSPADVVSPELRKRMFSYSGQGMVLLLLNVVVWDRSDMVILKAMNHDIRQIAFFSVAFSLTERVLLLPQAFCDSVGVTVMAQYGRGRERLQQLAATGARYSFMIALPLLVGMACISRPLVSLLYGKAYQAMIPVLMVCASLAVFKSLILPATAVLQATENQSFLIWTGCLCGALDIGLDFWLTPTYGAVGAGIANGTAQAVAAVAVWTRVHRLYRMDALFYALGRIVACGLVMAAAVLAVEFWIPGVAGMGIAVICGAVVWFLLLRLTGALDRTDRERFRSVAAALPVAFRPAFLRLLGMFAV